jgi:Mitochondrial mRNA-processing protein COX24, C-terminal
VRSTCLARCADNCLAEALKPLLPGVSGRQQAEFSADRAVAPGLGGRVTCRTWLAIRARPEEHRMSADLASPESRGQRIVGSVIKKRRKRMAKKKHRKLLKRTRIQRRRAGK